MESQTKCNDTTDVNIRSISASVERPESTKPYTLSDLHRLIFKLGEQEFNIEEAPADRFQMFVLLVAGSVRNVDTSVWPLEDRRDFVNALKAHCVKHHYQFPLNFILTETLTLTTSEPAQEA